MKTWRVCGIGLALLAGSAPLARSQAIPAPPPGAAVVPAVPVTPVPAATPTRNLWTFLCLSPEQKAACKIKFCNCALGQLINNSLKPASAMTGGIVPSLCPEVSPVDLAKSPDSSEGAAARIKQDEAGAKARRAAVRYLGTVDCNYWPEAVASLYNALRADRNECVRFEAALALSRGCCCNKRIVVALTLTVSGSKADGNPAENSERVKIAAAAALEHCLSCFVEVEEKPVAVEVPEVSPKPEPSPKPELPPPGRSQAAPDDLKKAAATPAEYYQRVEKMARKQIIEEARRALDRTYNGPPKMVQGAPMAHSFLELVEKASPNVEAVATAAPQMGTISAPVEKPVAMVPPKPRGLLVSSPRVNIQTSTINSAPVSQFVTVAPAPASTVKAIAPAAFPARVPSQDISKALNKDGDEKGRMLARLHQGVHADEREIAVNRLANLPGAGSSEVLQEIQAAATNDSSPAVRAACLRALSKFNVKTGSVINTVKRLQADPSALVRHEADKTMTVLSVGQSGYAPSGIQTISAESPMQIP